MNQLNAGTIYTVGHSNRTLDEFFIILNQAGICQLIDARSHPYSQRFPSFDQNTLGLISEEEQIAYTWLGRELGGLRREHSNSPHCALASPGLKGYADHMASKQFKRGIELLIRLGKQQPIAIMCTERDPSNCHRSLIADCLTLQGWQVKHLLAPHSSRMHSLHPLARSQNQQPVYDLLNQEQLKLSL